MTELAFARQRIRCIRADIDQANLPYVNHARIHRIRENHNASNDVYPAIELPTHYCDAICLEHADPLSSLSNQVM